MKAIAANRREVLSDAAFAFVGAVGALSLGLTATRFGEDSLLTAVAICTLPALPFLLARPDICAVAAVAALPFGSSVAGGTVGVQIGVPDLLLAITLLGVLYRLGFDPAFRSAVAALRPLLFPVGIYAATLFVVDAPHTTKLTVIALAQRVEVVGVPLLIGVALLTTRLTRIALGLFLAGACVIAATALSTHSVQDAFLGVQKNPAGQFVADSILISLVIVRRVPTRAGMFLYLSVGMYFTYSRGAILGVLVGLAAYLIVEARTLSRVFGRVLIAALLVYGVYSVLPDYAQQRLAGNVATTEFNDKIRHEYANDAEASIARHPWIGVGSGNYLGGTSSDLSRTNDPHDVILLEAAEGGYPGLAAFVILQLAALAVVFARRRSSRWAAPAIAVQCAILTHSIVDIYWVRGTPVLGWLLVGLAMQTGGRPAPSATNDDPALTAVPAR